VTGDYGKTFYVLSVKGCWLEMEVILYGGFSLTEDVLKKRGNNIQAALLLVILAHKFHFAN